MDGGRDSRKFPKAGGALLAAAILIGVVVGMAMRQPSLGALIGFGVGVALVVLIWLVDRSA